MEPVIKMGDSTQRLHMYLLPRPSVKAFRQKMSPSVFLNEGTFRHLYTTSLGQLVERVLQSSIILRLPETRLGGYSIEFDKI